MRNAGLLVSRRLHPAVMVDRRLRLAEVVAQRTDHHGHRRSPLQTFNPLTGLVHDHQGVRPHVALRVPLRILPARRQRHEFRQQSVHDVEIPGESEANRWPFRLQKQLLDFTPDPLGREVIQGRRSTDRPGVFVHHQIEARRKLDAAEDAQAVLTKRPAVHHPQAPLPQIALAIEWIDQLAGDRIAGHGVDGEVAPSCRFSDRQRRIAFDGEALVAAADLGLAAGQRHVDRTKLIDGETLADGVDAAE